MLRVIPHCGRYDYYESDVVKIWLIGVCFDQNYKRLSAVEYLKNTNIANDYNGCFTVIVLRENTVTVNVDRFGLGRAFYYVSDSNIIISDNVDAIVSCINNKLSIKSTFYGKILRNKNG